MTVINNERRAERAVPAVEAHIREMYGGSARVDWDLGYRDECMDELLVDLVTDLWHLADQRKVDMYRVIQQAQEHFNEEKEEERNGKNQDD